MMMMTMMMTAALNSFGYAVQSIIYLSEGANNYTPCLGDFQRPRSVSPPRLSITIRPETISAENSTLFKAKFRRAIHNRCELVDCAIHMRIIVRKVFIYHNTCLLLFHGRLVLRVRGMGLSGA
ncbi:uncharacterized protein BDCG_01708 [Blastomyces dermatitidis ER-3]|uniref:Secreted protein n=1 Tax=Ajellomyces dermatitidis (strain ER-3 / ATCC MYA-2586) TaxID=559297 RepID=A0ABP2ES95_AJEDR|nr:uncharacterized protein BDCG_01708 [Blastomyces dermatitidis ER-3]EEQ86588.2 hypothetical protein BDCG_01708 [Blastomyces dermatitidis ER-3]